jgi:hypothetical protein
MKLRYVTQNPLSVCVAITILAGCSGSAQLPNPIAQAPLGNGRIADDAAFLKAAAPARSDLFSTGSELLTGVNFRFHPKCPHEGPEPRSWSETFSASGTATGPYPGTFTGQGSWEAVAHLPQFEFWSFDESFTITSGTSQVSGTISAYASAYPGPDSCTGFGPAVLQYTTKSVQGNANVKVTKYHFGETLDGL